MRPFNSQDEFVRNAIQSCLSSSTTTDQCADILGCIINHVDAATAGRWSAGSSILALIPTVTGLTGVSIDETVSLAEDNVFLACGLAFATVGSFTPRFFSSRAPTVVGIKAVEHEQELVTARLSAMSLDAQGSSRNGRVAFLLGSGLAVCAGIEMIWLGAYPVWMYAVVVWSCPSQAHVPVWIALAQGLVLLNVACRSLVFECVRVRKLVLRKRRTTFIAKGLGLFTAVLQLALFVYGTAILGSMTMYPASNAVYTLSLLTASSSLVRGIAAASNEKLVRGSVVLDVTGDLPVLKKHAEDAIANRISPTQQQPLK